MEAGEQIERGMGARDVGLLGARQTDGRAEDCPCGICGHGLLRGGGRSKHEGVCN